MGVLFSRTVTPCHRVGLAMNNTRRVADHILEVTPRHLRRRNKARWVAVATVILLGVTSTLEGCNLVSYVPPAPPNYDLASCEPSHNLYEIKARSTRDIAWADRIPEDPQKALEFCKDLIKFRGWSLAEKSGNPATQWSRLTTTFPQEVPVILLAKNFSELPLVTQAQTMCHELVHTYQWERDSPRVFGPTYILNDGTWSYEVPAYRVNIRIWRNAHPHASRRAVRKVAAEYADILWDTYRLDNNLPICLKSKTIDILLDEDFQHVQ